MVRVDFGRIDEFESVRFADADEVIIKFMVKLFDKAEDEGRLINWIDFKKYCMAGEGKEFPMELMVPEPVIDRCIEEARKKTD